MVSFNVSPPSKQTSFLSFGLQVKPTHIGRPDNLAAFKVVYAKIYADDGEYNTGWPDESSIIGYKRMRY